MNPLTRRLLAGALLCAAGVALLALFFYGSDRFNHYDSTLTAHLLAAAGSGRESLAELASDAANPLPLLVALAGITAMAVVWGRPWHLLAAGGVILFANLTTQIMKLVLAHPRLQGALGASYPIEIGYPSGHTTAAFSAGFALWLVAPPRWRGWAAAAGLAYGCMVGAGVVVAGWHFISDVLGAILVVGFWGLLALAALVAARLEAPDDWLPRPE
ncbi:MAG: phosphatase PAP2 family protein [Thermoleophilia bacterium]|nr:phosphatase PAP2 family protein [Thermoleophilia bacterium]